MKRHESEPVREQQRPTAPVEMPRRKAFEAPLLVRHRELPAVTAGSLNLGG